MTLLQIFIKLPPFVPISVKFVGDGDARAPERSIRFYFGKVRWRRTRTSIREKHSVIFDKVRSIQR